VIFPLAWGARFSASLEIQGGVGPYTGVLVSASLDEQFMSGAEVYFTFQGFAQLFADIFLLRDNSDNILLRVARTYPHDETLWYERVHE